jgi:predicted ATPase/DNA-binding XRE family transcriptional regulator
VLRALREARGVSQEGWAAQLGVGRRTVQRWEQGDSPPDLIAEESILAYCEEKGLFRRYDEGILAGVTLTPARLQGRLAEARLGARSRGSTAANVPAPLGHAASATLSGSLPTPLTSFVGREKELADLTRLLQHTRLLTLTGPGGVGKTRLAVAVVASVASHYPDGIIFVDLAPITDPTLVITAIAHALEIRETAGQSLANTVTGALRYKQMLLLLDNLEQVIAAAPLLTKLLAAAPGLTCLVTSRAVLRLAGEQEYLVLPLPTRVGSTDDPSVLSAAPAVALFVDRASLVHPGFTITADNLETMAAICDRLDGLPLAIELAAARTRLLPLDALLTRLDHRLSVLSGGPQDQPTRQQTLRATIAWSYDLLAPNEQRLFRQLAVFAGGWSLESAEAVCRGDGDAAESVLDDLASLHNKNLVGRVDRATAEPRLVMLETVREFAMLELVAHGEAGDVRSRHAAYFAALAERFAAGNHVDHGPSDVSSRLAAEIDNGRAALSWLLAQSDGAAAARLALHVAPIWAVRGQLTEGRYWLEGALAKLHPIDRALRAHVLRATAEFAHDQGDYAVAQPRYAAALDALRALDDRPAVAAVLRRLAIITHHQGDQQRGRTFLEESLAISRAVGHEPGVADALVDLSILTYQDGDTETARRLYEEALAIYRTLDDQRGVAVVLERLAVMARDRGDFDAAYRLQKQTVAIDRQLGDSRHVAYATYALAMITQIGPHPDEASALFRASIDTFRQVGDKVGLATSLATLAIHRLMRGEGTEPGLLLDESLRLNVEMGHVVGAITCLEGLASVALVQRASVRAVRLYGAAARLRETTNTPRPTAYRTAYDNAVATARRALGEQAFAAAWAEGRALSLDAAIALALEQMTGG